MFVSLFQNAEVKKSSLEVGGGGECYSYKRSTKLTRRVILDVCGLNSITEAC